jgi:hypothetical protein
MDTQDKIMVLREATKAFQLVKRTADALLEHAATCRVCRSKTLRYFFKCHDKDNLAFDYLAAKVDADEHFLEVRNIQLELQSLAPEGPEDPKLLNWLEGLHKLKDDRSE